LTQKGIQQSQQYRSLSKISRLVFETSNSLKQNKEDLCTLKIFPIKTKWKKIHQGALLLKLVLIELAYNYHCHTEKKRMWGCATHSRQRPNTDVVRAVFPNSTDVREKSRPLDGAIHKKKRRKRLTKESCS